jgi:putative ABC transport system permease protein
MAKRYWPHGSAVGKQFRFDAAGTRWITVIGIAGDVHETNVETPSHPAMYFLYDQMADQKLNLPGFLMPRDLAVRVAGNPLNYANELKQAIWSVDPEQPISDVQSMQHLVNSRMQTYSLEAKLFGFFSFAALLIAALGIYGLMSYSVTQRTQEIGIRMALGAQRGQVLTLFLFVASRLIIIGVILGIIGSIAATRMMGSLLFGIVGTGFVAGVIPLIVLAAVVFIAAWIPSHRAAMVAPIEALRRD